MAKKKSDAAEAGARAAARAEASKALGHLGAPLGIPPHDDTLKKHDCVGSNGSDKDENSPAQSFTSATSIQHDNNDHFSCSDNENETKQNETVKDKSDEIVDASKIYTKVQRYLNGTNNKESKSNADNEIVSTCNIRGFCQSC